jgi:molybdate transport system substrate-binding protein
MRKRVMAAIFLTILGVGGRHCLAAETAPPIVVFAAASLSDALQETARAYERKTGQTITPSFAASSALARQIEAGSPADLFISADEEWMDYLAKHQLINAGSRKDLLSNRLILIAPASSTVKLKIASGFALAAALGAGRLALADPDSVPAGRYARAALTSLKVWDTVTGKLAPAENVRAALAFVARNEAPLGIVYETDALREREVRVVDTFPADSHPPIVYPIALTAQAKSAAAGFVEFLQGAQGMEIFSRHGFKSAH